MIVYFILIFFIYIRKNMIEYEKHLFFMRKAFLISKSISLEEVPVVSIVVHKNKIIGKSYNRMVSSNNPNEHAESLSLKKASKNMKSIFLKNSYIYITQEPCIMCIENVINYKIRNIIYASSSVNKNRWNYLQYLVKKGTLDIVINIRENKCKKIIKKFFYTLRSKFT